MKIPVEIDVNQAAFLAFYDAFQKHRAALDDMPGQWGKVADETARAAEGAEKMSGALVKVDEGFTRAQALQTSLRHASDATARAWGALEKHTSNVAGHLKDATGSLLKWSGLTTLIGGLAGGAGFMGMDALGSHISSGRTGAMRAGTTYGGREALGINFGRFGDTDGVLSRIAGIMSSADHTALRNLGITEEEIRNGDPADIAAKAFQKLQERARKVKPGYLGDWMHSNRVDEIFDVGQARQARSMGDDEMKELQEGYRRDRPRLELTPQAQLGWTKFVMQLDLAAGIIGKAFAENLSHLTKGLGALSESFSKILEALFRKDGPLEHWLDGLSVWLNKVADDIGRPDFEAWLEKFFDGVKTLAEWTGKLISGIADLARWLGVSPASAATSYGGNGAGGAPGDDASGAPFKTGVGEDPEVVAYIQDAAKRIGIDPNIALRVARSEGLKGFHPSRGEWSAGSNDRGTSFGPYQAHFASNIPGYRAAGQGDAMMRQGINARDISQWKRVVDWQLRYAKNHGWSEWHGWRGAPRAGLDVAPQQPSPAPESSNLPQNSRTKVMITRPPGGDIATTANAISHATP